MTFSPRAIEAALNAWHSQEGPTDRQQQSAMQAALSAALAVDGVELVEIGSLSEHKFGLEWFERVFQVPLGDKPGALKVDEIRAMIAAASDDPAPALQGWQPIESAPEETEILGFWQRRVHNGTDGLGVTIWRGGSWRSVDAPNQKYTAPTHWQPLPPPPAASDREERR